MRQPIPVILLTLWGLVVFFGLGVASWQYQGDPVLLNYASWLWVEHGQLPYRDVFETSMPGTFFVHALIMKLGLDGDTAFLILGLALLGTLGLIGTRILSRANLSSGPFFIAAYMPLMLLFGPNSLVQRELIATVFIAAAVLVGFQTPRTIWIGFLYGLAALIKPQLALTAPIVVLASILLHGNGLIRGVLASLMGFLAPLLATGLWLWSVDALEDFLFLVRAYLPLHIQQSTYHVFLAPDDRLKYLAKEAVKFGGFWILIAGPVTLTLLQLWCRKILKRHQHIMIATLTLLCATYSLIPILAGQFWNYHYFPFIFFASLSAVACLTFAAKSYKTEIRTIALLAPAVVLFAQAAILFDGKLPEKNQRDTQMVLDMEAALARWLPENGRAQPIDWTKGAVHAMLHQRTTLATPFLYDYHFRHHVSGPVTSKLRETFMEALRATPPDLFLEVPTRPKMKGLDISYDWPEFDRFLEDNYTIVEAAEHHVIHLKNND